MDFNRYMQLKVSFLFAGCQAGGANAPPPLNFGPEVQYFDEFLKKDYVLFVFIVIQNEKVF